MRRVNIRALTQRNDRIVVAGHHQRRLFEFVQPVHAGPSRQCPQLIQVAVDARRRHAAGVALGEHVVFPEVAAVDRAGDALEIAGRQIAQRGRHTQQHRRPRWHHQVAGGRGGQNQPVDAIAELTGELLRESAAPRNAHHVDAIDAEVVEQFARELRVAGQAADQHRRLRRADAREIERQRGDAGHAPHQRL